MENEVPKRGRPTDFTPELAEKICKRLADGESLRNICRDEDMPHRTTVHKWLLDVKGKRDFIDQYEEAMKVRTDNMFDELMDVADDGQNDYMEKELDSGKVIEVVNHEHIQRSRLRADVRKWYLSKIAPKRFGDKLDVTSGGEKITQALVRFIGDEGDETKNESGDEGDSVPESV